MASEIGLILISLGVEAVCSGKKLPVQMFGALSGVVDFVLGKFSGKPMERTFVNATDKTLNNLIGQKFKVFKKRGLMKF
jgi:hypothetical protein